MTATGTAAGIDREAVVRALGLFWGSRRGILQTLPSARWEVVSLASDGPDRVAEVAESFSDGKGLYFTLNRLREDFVRGPKHFVSRDFAWRDWLLVDLDAVRTAGTNATAAEQDATAVVAMGIRDRLGRLGWPHPVVVDSGNGTHLLYRIDLPCDEISGTTLGKVLRQLAAEHDTPAVEVDRKCHDAKRISKLPGTWVRKGPPSDERPHRLARLLTVPETLGIVCFELLTAIANPPAKTTVEVPVVVPAKADPWIQTATDGASEAYARSALEREVGRVASANGHRNSTLYEAALKLGGLVGAGVLIEAEVVAQLERAARAAGLGQDGDSNEIRRAIQNGLAVGKATPRSVPERPAHARFSHEPEKSPLESLAGERLTVRLSEVRPESIEWLWPGRIPLGFLTLFAGQTGAGKSFIALDLIARLSRGGELPGEGSFPGPVGALVISEDPIRHVIVPRLISLGADLSRVECLTWKAASVYSLSDTVLLHAAVQGVGGCKLILIDPPTNFLNAKDEHKNTEVRRILMRLVEYAETWGVAIILITHTNKSVGKTDALDRVVGSIAWTTAPRQIFVVARDDEDAALSYFVHRKNQLGLAAKTLPFRIVAEGMAARVEWQTEIDLSAEAALKMAPRKTRGVRAVEWLEERFRERREWDSQTLLAEAREVGLSRNALFSPEVQAKPISRRLTVGADGSRFWRWIAQEGWPDADLAPEKRGRWEP